MKDPISKKGSQKLTTPKVVLWPLLVGLYIHTPQTPNQLSWAWSRVVFTVKDCGKGIGHWSQAETQSKRGGWNFRVGTKRGLPVFSAWRWSQGVALWNAWLTLFIQLSLWVQGIYHIPHPGDNISRVPPGLFVCAWKEAWGLRNGRQKRQRYKRQDRAAG